jgi:hypothetical protein
MALGLLLARPRQRDAYFPNYGKQWGLAAAQVSALDRTLFSSAFGVKLNFRRVFTSRFVIRQHWFN